MKEKEEVVVKQVKLEEIVTTNKTGEQIVKEVREIVTSPTADIDKIVESLLTHSNYA